jgi:hypothetical protein
MEDVTVEPESLKAAHQRPPKPKLDFHQLETCSIRSTI